MLFNLENNPILLPHQVKILKTFFATDFATTFFLTGGTALSAFYLAHRDSKDLDLFTIEAFDTEILNHVLNELSQITNSQTTVKVKSTPTMKSTWRIEMTAGFNGLISSTNSQFILAILLMSTESVSIP